MNLKKKSTWLLLASFLILAWVGHSTYRALSDREVGEIYTVLQEGEAFPSDMPLMTAEGKLTNFEPYVGKVVLINYWASWCGPCLKEMPSLYALHEKFKARGFEILAVSMDTDLEAGKKLLEGVAGPIPFPQFKGNEQAVYNRFPIEGLPYTVVVDKEGLIQYSQPGERNWMSRDSINFIEGML